MSYHLKKSDGAVFGPIEEATLEAWARDGRIGPDDLVSEDLQTWQPVVHLSQLGMEWLVRLPDGSLYGPLSLPALEALAQLGELELNAEVLHRETARRSTLGMALRRREEGLGLPPKSPLTPRWSPVADAPAEPLPPGWKDIAQSKDHFEREANRWRTLYLQERERWTRQEQELQARAEELRKSELASRVQLEHAEKQLAELREDHRRLEQALSEAPPGETAARAASWMESYQTLSHRYDELLARFTARAEEVQAFRDARQKAETEAQTRLEKMEAQMRRERAEADESRRKLSTAEEAHLNLAKAYRELNDRFIRSRQRPPDSDDDDGGPRIKLNRSS